MTVPPAVPRDSAVAPAGALLGSDRVELGHSAALAALGRLDRLRRPYGPVLRYGGRAAFLLAPGTADVVPELLGWLGWGEELGLDLRAHPAIPAIPQPRETPPDQEVQEVPAGPEALRVPQPRGVEDRPPRPERRPGGGRAAAVWLRPGSVWSRSGPGGPGLDLSSPDLLRLLDCLAQAAFDFSYASRMSLGTRPRSLTL